MRLTCPHCGTEYDVPDGAVAGRARTLRCSFCGHQWRHAAPAADDLALAIDTPESAAAASAEVPPPENEPIIDAPPLVSVAPPGYRPPNAREVAEDTREPRRPVAPPPTRRAARAPLIVLAVLVVVVIAALAAHRPIARAWPASAPVFLALGLK